MSSSPVLGVPKSETRPVPLSAIRKDARAEGGITLDPTRVAAFAGLIRAGIVLPPIRVWWDTNTHWLSDGLHRLAAVEEAGWAELLCDVHLGTLSDAQWDSYASSSARFLPAGAGRILGLPRSGPTTSDGGRS